MTTFYIPIENITLPADDPLRWHFLVVDVDTIDDADLAGFVYADSLPRRRTMNGPERCYRRWASERTLPTAGEMQQRREAMDAACQTPLDYAVYSLSETFRSAYL